MKKKVDRRYRPRVSRDVDLRKNLSPDQLAGIGEVTIAYNEAEVYVDTCLGVCLNVAPELYFEISNRINGVDGRIAIVKEIAKTMREIKPETFAMIENTFAALKEYKGYRDAIAHAHVLDAPSGIGEMIRRQGEHVHVLLTKPALNALYERLAAVRLELIAITLAFNAATFPGWERLMASVGDEQDQEAAERESERQVQEYVSQLQRHQTARRSLPPLPQFPGELPVLPKSGDESASPPN